MILQPVCLSSVLSAGWPCRFRGPFDVFDFQLSGGDVAAIDALDTGVRGGPEPDQITLETFGRPIPRRDSSMGKTPAFLARTV